MAKTSGVAARSATAQQDAPVPFPLEVKWDSLLAGLTLAGLPGPDAQSTPGATETAALILAEPSPVPATAISLGSRWEMKVPKMARPAAPQRPRRLAAPGADFDSNLHFSIGSDGAIVSWWRNSPFSTRALAGVVLIGLCWWGAQWGRGRPPAPTDTELSVGGAGWSTEWSGDPGGSRLGRQLSVYRPTTGRADYRLDFRWPFEKGPAAFVFRMNDSRNYYGAKIEVVNAGRFPVVRLTHFAVVGGVESARTSKLATLTRVNGGAVPVRLDVSGASFVISVAGEPLEYWTDDRLKHGMLGFYNERALITKAETVRISLVQGKPQA
jgi:hypothetical protein